VIRIVQEQRDARYSMLRGYFHGADDDTVDELDHERLGTVSLPEATTWIGEPIAALALQALQVRVVSLRRSNGQSLKVNDQTTLQGGDTLVLSGTPQALAVAEQALLTA
jgi:CPA2 family monovalent cation:H+ antiporter-2